MIIEKVKINMLKVTIDKLELLLTENIVVFQAR